MGDGEVFIAPDQESLGCLLLVTAFAEVVEVLGPVVAEAAARVMMSPTLGDVVELRFADLGPRPTGGSGFTTVVSRIADELMHPVNDAGRCYFTLVIADHSAAEIEQVWTACRGNDVIAALPLRCRGLAVTDDRQTDTKAATMPVPAVDVIVPSGGGWRRRELIDELRRYAGDVLHSVAAGRERGLSRAELTGLRAEGEEVLLFRSAPAADDSNEAEPEPASESSGADPGQGRPVRLTQPTEMPQLPGWAPSPSSARTEGPRAAPEPPDVPGQPGIRQSQLARRGAQADGAAGSAGTVGQGRQLGHIQPAEDAAELRDASPVFVILADGSGAGGPAAWRRSRKLLAEVDSKLAAAAETTFLIWVLTADANAGKASLRVAGSIGRRGLRQPAYVDFAQLLTQARAAIRRECSALARSYRLTARPAVLLFTAEAPLADAFTTEAYLHLAREASVIWVVPEQSMDLMSPVFLDSVNSVAADHRGVADEIVSILRDNAAATVHGKGDENAPPGEI